MALTSVRTFLLLVADDLAAGAEPNVVQPSMSQRVTLSSMDVPGPTLLHELLGTLRRCLRQSAEVRRAVYAGLPALVARDRPAQVMVKGALAEHLRALTGAGEGATCSLDLRDCLDPQRPDAVLEPLPELLRAAQDLCLPWAAAAATGGPEPACPLQQAYAALQSGWEEATLEQFGVRVV